MIPKVIHYCWFGHSPKPALFQRCIASWKKYCPDYEIIEWNEDNFDISQNDYAREAYEEKKWAFVTDYARLWIVYNHGGIYLDTDVEIIKEFDLAEYEITGFEIVAETEGICQVHYVISTTVADDKNKDLEGRFHITSTWKRIDGRWKLVFNMDSRIGWEV